MTMFSGFQRYSGPAGIRNEVLVISGELACNPWVVAIADQVPGCCAVTHKHGGGNTGKDKTTFNRIMSNILIHPNVYGSILVISGNEDYDSDEVVAKANIAQRPVHVLSIQDHSGTPSLVEAGAVVATEYIRDAKTMQRAEMDIQQLRIGLNCAGTDTTSEHTSHLVCGLAMDSLVAQNATVVLGEIPELFGMTEEFFNRTISEPVECKLKDIIEQHTVRLGAGGEDINDNELCKFNVQGGLATLAEKARVSVMKAGRVRLTGCALMETTGWTPV